MISAKDIEVLRQRWTKSETEKAVQYLNGSSKSPLQNLTDFRGLVIASFVKERQFKDIDLTACRLEGFGQFGFCRFENCNFSYAELNTNLGRQFFGCAFERANMRNLVLRGEFSDCNFGFANLNRAGGSGIRFCRCSFDHTDFRRAILLNCVFEDCTMQHCVFGNGSLGNARFVRTQPNDCNFKNTILDGASFT